MLYNSSRDDVTRALAEDVGSGDLTAALLPAHAVASATIMSREAAILCGRAWVDEVFRQLDPTITIAWQYQDGASLTANATIAELSGNAAALLTGERTALNFLQTLSATATATAGYVAKIAAFPNCRLLDSRKTIPGLRMAQKYAVRCGGGHNHRLGLYDAILIKENHILSAGSIKNAITAAYRHTPAVMVEIEVETLTELDEALDAGAKRIMLDNFSIPQLSEAVQLNAQHSKRAGRSEGAARAELEASGNITLANIAEVAATGVDYISTGAITKNIQAVDLSMRIIAPRPYQS